MRKERISLVVSANVKVSENQTYMTMEALTIKNRY